MLTLFQVLLITGPLAVYCCLIGYARNRKHPTLVGGGRDLGALGIAMSGLFIVGPAELFFPNAAFNLLGTSVWIVILTLYLFILLFAILNSRPRIVVYGLDADRLTHVVRETLAEIDPHASWMQSNFNSPKLELSGLIEPSGRGSLAHIIATRQQQNVAGWMRLERLLAPKIQRLESSKDSIGTIWLAFGMAVLGLIGYVVFVQSNLVAEGIHEWLRW